MAAPTIEEARTLLQPANVLREAADFDLLVFDPTTRISTGVPGLDPIVNRGYFLGSTTVVAGISRAPTRQPIPPAVGTEE